MILAVVVALLAILLAVGTAVSRLVSRARSSVKAEQAITARKPAPPVPASEVDFTLVAEEQGAGPPTSALSSPAPVPLEQPVAEIQLDDATALSSDQYQARLSRSRKTVTTAGPASRNPRELPGGIESGISPPGSRATRQESPSVATSGRTSAKVADVARTRPVPVYQPLPEVSRRKPVRQDGIVRFDLTIDRHGRVSSVQILEGMPGMTDRMVGAVQKWRFRPATLNGVPVEGKFETEVTFNAE